MLTLVRSTPSVCASARATSPAPARTAVKPYALAGARVTRARADRVETVERAVVLCDVACAPFAPSARYSVTIEHGHTDEARVSLGLAEFDAALADLRAMSARDLDVQRSQQLLAIARSTLERHARTALAAELDARVERARAARDRALAYALDCIDEAPQSQREAIAKLGATLVDRTIDAHAPTLHITPIALVHLAIERRTSAWRLTCDGRSASLAWSAYADSSLDGATCPSCAGVRRGFTVCARCDQARCDRCALFCAACRRWSCGACAKGDRCASCGASGLVGGAR
ncbi:MAG: hypothetical protein JNK05_17730 [Myxococcales bacterium]|nr:hypothetical protein [Myxococcales bacterium]